VSLYNCKILCHLTEICQFNGIFLLVLTSQTAFLQVADEGCFLDRLIIMSHVGRPYDKKTKTLTVKQDDAVDAVVGYLQRKLRIKFAIPKFHVFQNEGIEDVDTSVNWLIHDLRDRKIGGIYLPNTRWFAVSGS